jgi:hypothetical protein
MFRVSRRITQRIACVAQPKHRPGHRRRSRRSVLRFACPQSCRQNISEHPVLLNSFNSAT